MSRLQELLNERQKVLKEIDGIVAMRRGSVVSQYLPAVKNGKPSKQKLGPYHLFSFKKNGKTESKRIKSKTELRRLKHQVDYYHRFRDLCLRLVEIGEEICEEQEKRN